MVNLEKLQIEIDNLLENETSESLSDWIFKRKFSDLNKILGEGVFISLNNLVSDIQFVQNIDSPQNSTDSTDSPDSTDPTFPYRMAA